MLKEFSIKDNEFSFTKEKRSELGLRLASIQRRCIEKNIPVIIMIDGWESSGKGYVMNDLVRELDSKHTLVHMFDDFARENDYAYTRQFWRALPAKGSFGVFYRSMYFTLFNDLKSKKKLKNERIEDLRNLEKMLTDDNTVILKFFLHIDEDTIKENVEVLKEDKYRKFFVDRYDKKQVKKYDEFLEHMSDILNETNFEFSPWIVVPSVDKKEASKEILGMSIKLIEEKLDSLDKDEKVQLETKESPSKKIIENVDLSLAVSDEDYDAQIDQLQEEASNLAYELYVNKVPTVMVFEGIDAAGKGGTIQRLLREIDPRLYKINPTSAPNEVEGDHHYMWRFYNNLPKKGHMSIYDRSWYGRVMVERIEGFAKDNEWSRAYDEINKVEEGLVNDGVLLVKYLLVISKDEQEKRFKDRQENKPYKLTDEDWRNREKWDDYIIAIDDMLRYTNTDYAPWVVLPSENKKYARLEVLKDFIDRAKKALKK